MNNKNEGIVTYKRKDIILYALSIGFGADEDHYSKDLRYLYEEHQCFQATPLFGLVLLFWAHEKIRGGGIWRLPAFPPPLMKSMQSIPREYLKVPLVDLEQYPVLHMFQSIEWPEGAVMPLPSDNESSTTVHLRGSLVSLSPKDIGTFVNTVVHVSDSANGQNDIICVLQSTTLLFGVPAGSIEPYEDKSMQFSHEIIARKPDTLWFQTEPISIGSNQALLYRIASGDTNQIHVDSESLPTMLSSENEKPKPLLHGLCSLGIAGRILVQRLNEEGEEVRLRKLQGTFRRPVFVGDSISMKVWRNTKTIESDGRMDIFFEVHNVSRDEIAVSRGYTLAVVPPDAKL